MHFVSVHVVHSYSSIDTATARKKPCFILSDRTDYHKIDSVLIALHTFVRPILTSLLVDETLLLRYVKLSTYFRCLPLTIKMASSRLKHMYSILFAFTWRPMLPAVCSWLCSRESAWVLARNATSSTWCLL